MERQWTLGHFWVQLSLHFKVRVSAKSLLWKSVFIHIEIRSNYHNKNFALRLALKERPEGNSEMAYLFDIKTRQILHCSVLQHWELPFDVLRPSLILLPVITRLSDLSFLKQRHKNAALKLIMSKDCCRSVTFGLPLQMSFSESNSLDYDDAYCIQTIKSYQGYFKPFCEYSVGSLTSHSVVLWTRVVRRGLPFIVLIREDLKV